MNNVVPSREYSLAAGSSIEAVHPSISGSNRPDHGFGGRGGIFFGSWVRPKWLTDARRAVSARWYWNSDSRPPAVLVVAVVVVYPEQPVVAVVVAVAVFVRPDRAGLKRSRSLSILCRLRRNNRATTIRAIFLPRFFSTRS